MILANTLSETLNGGFNGLYGEVVTCDTYRLRQLDFQPDFVFDIGANVGVFTRFARQLFPNATVVSVEPDPVNCAHFRKFTQDDRVILLERALGSGIIYHGLGAVNGSGETYLSSGLGYPLEEIVKNTAYVPSPVKSISLEEIILPYWCPKMRTVIKIDCEGAENCLWQDRSAMVLLQRMDYIVMEIHDYGLTHEDHLEVKAQTKKALGRLELTHRCEREGVHFWARRIAPLGSGRQSKTKNS